MATNRNYVPARRETMVSYDLSWTWKSDPHAGFGFPCNANGDVLPGLSDAAQANLEMCRTSGELDGPYVREYRHTYTHPATCTCDCGATVTLDYDPATCDRCNADYNLSGQRLAPRRFWGEETGETFA